MKRRDEVVGGCTASVDPRMRMKEGAALAIRSEERQASTERTGEMAIKVKLIYGAETKPKIELFATVTLCSSLIDRSLQAKLDNDEMKTSEIIVERDASEELVRGMDGMWCKGEEEGEDVQ